MRVYIKNETSDYRYPEDMKMILDYLNSHGKIMVKEKTIEDYYYDFCEEKYDAGWLGSITEERLEEFADWLAKKDI